MVVVVAHIENANKLMETVRQNSFQQPPWFLLYSCRFPLFRSSYPRQHDHRHQLLRHFEKCLWFCNSSSSVIIIITGIRSENYIGFSHAHTHRKNYNKNQTIICRHHHHHIANLATQLPSDFPTKRARHKKMYEVGVICDHIFIFYMHIEIFSVIFLGTYHSIPFHTTQKIACFFLYLFFLRFHALHTKHSISISSFSLIKYKYQAICFARKWKG